MDVGYETAISDLYQNGIDAGHLFGAVDRGLTHGETFIRKPCRYAAVACAVPHLNEDLLLGADEFF